MKLIAILTMPNVGSWNGKWSDEDNLHTIEMTLFKGQNKELFEKFKNGDKISGYYNFGDGWGANVEIRAKIKGDRITNNFAGYEWMANSLLKNGRIICD